MNAKVLDAHPTPKYWAWLSDDDKAHYCQLRRLINPLSLRTARDQLSMRFQVIVNEIQRYSIQRNNDDWRRCLVCGIVWFDGALAISTRQLQKLIGKCKSSINAGFQSLGYFPSPMSSSYASQLVAFFPFMPQNTTDFRQWTIRILVKSEVRSPMRESGHGELRELTLTEEIDSFDLTYQVLREQEEQSLEIDRHFLTQSESDGFTFSWPN